jgi:hypothetical protein
LRWQTLWLLGREIRVPTLVAYMAGPVAKAAARTAETVCAAIGEILGAFTSQECANYSETQDMREPKIIRL